MKIKAFAWSIFVTAMFASSTVGLTGCQGYAAPPEDFLGADVVIAPPVKWDATDATAEHTYRGLSQ